MAYFECEGRKSIDVASKSPTTSSVQLLKNVLIDRDIHALVYERKKDGLMILGLAPNDSKELSKFLFEHRTKEIQIGE